MDITFNTEERSFLRKFNWDFILVVFALNIVGLVNLYSATHGPYSETMVPLFRNQIIWLIAGWTIFFTLTFIDYAWIIKLSLFAFILNLMAILYVEFFGEVALGAQRWIDFGFFRYQPSETMKLCLILMLSSYFSGRSSEGRGMGLRQLIIPLLIMLIPIIFVIIQPDLGTGLTLAAVGGTIILFMKVRTSIILSAIVAISIAAPLYWNYGMRDYQKNRVINFLSPTNDPQGSGYNSIQSKIAVGSGQMMGKGFRKGTQSQLEFLPERHTDFIFSVLSEEFGFIGSISTLGLFALLFYLGLQIALHARDKLGALLCVGVMGYLFWHMFVNVGMVIGLLPIVGVPLPLLSYGGSSMLTTMTGLGLVSSVAYRRYLFN